VKITMLPKGIPVHVNHDRPTYVSILLKVPLKEFDLGGGGLTSSMGVGW